MQAAGAEALAIGASPQFARNGVRLAELALQRHLPTICQWREMAEQGC
jgi:putative tryptophan/tyrosine transport system substrate-binding protein